MLKNLLFILVIFMLKISFSTTQFSTSAYLKAIRSGAIADLALFFRKVASGDPSQNQVII